jgi:DNA-binding winged helix-turn-helix (wHTH) protein
MATSDSDTPVQMPPMRLRFDRYILDLDRGCLLIGDKEIALRPKTFTVLHYLVENSGRLVSKDELFAAVWPNLNVTDDALVQSIGELRRAFGDEGARLIKTIPRRGYRFELAVSVDISGHRSEADAGQDSAARSGVAQWSGPVRGTPTFAHVFTRAFAASHIRLLAALAFGVLFLASALWVSVGTDWTYRNNSTRECRVLGYLLAARDVRS